MALMSPATTEEDVDRHTEVFSEAVAELAAVSDRVLTRYELASFH